MSAWSPHQRSGHQLVNCGAAGQAIAGSRESVLPCSRQLHDDAWRTRTGLNILYLPTNIDE